MYCQFCGNRLNDGAKFCKYCGKAIEDETDETITDEEEEEKKEEKEEEEVIFVTKCGKCGKTFSINVEPNDFHKHSIIYECTQCHEEVEVQFLGYCHDCNNHVGFIYHSLRGFGGGLKDTAHLVASNVSNPFNGVVNFFKTFTDSIPTAPARGWCPVCDKKYLKCPDCGNAVKIPLSRGDAFEPITCEKCGTQSRE